MLRFLLEKEFKLIFRNSFMPRIILVFPCMVMLLMPWAANMEVKDLKLCIVDNDRSSSSSRLVHKLEANTYFHFKGLSSSYDEGIEAIEKGEADVAIVIPYNFEKELKSGKKTEVSIAVNTVNGIRGNLGGAYVSQTINQFGTEWQKENPQKQNIMTSPQVIVGEQNMFNPYLDYKRYMVPALMAMLLTMLCGFLPALNIVSEKEKGTIEQMNVTPVSKFIFILSKLIPYWIIGFIILSLCFVIAYFVYGMIPAGSFISIYLGAILFVLVISGLGLVISNHSATMQQAMFVMWFCMLVLILMSGLFTPISSMPDWAQSITYLNPLRYFMSIMRGIYLRGSDIADEWFSFVMLAIYGFLLNIWAIISYRKKE